MTATVQAPYRVPWKHGTKSGARRHYRHGEKPCPACLAAARADTAARQSPHGHADPYSPFSVHEERGAIRNGIPVVPYEYRARVYPHAVRVLQRAERTWGKPPEEEQ